MISDFANWLIAGGGALIGGAVSFVCFLPYKKRAEALKNEITLSSEWRNHYTEMRDECKEKDAKIDELYGDIKTLRDEHAKIAKEREILAIENTRLKVLKCEVAGCPNRTPPTGF